MNPLIQLKQTTAVFVVAFGLACFGLSQAVQAISPRPDGAIPHSRRRKDATLSLVSGGAKATQELVGIRFFQLAAATSTPALALGRWRSTAGMKIRPPARQRFC